MHLTTEVGAFKHTFQDNKNSVSGLISYQKMKAKMSADVYISCVSSEDAVVLSAVSVRS